jgi:hypothetical protein
MTVMEGAYEIAMHLTINSHRFVIRYSTAAIGHFIVNNMAKIRIISIVKTTGLYFFQDR